MDNYTKEIVVNSLLFFRKYFLLFFLPIIAHSQNVCKINYTVIPTGGTFENNDDVKKMTTANRYTGLDEALKSINYELIINGNESYFRQVPSLNLVDRISRTARNLAGSAAYLKNGSQTIKLVNLSGESFNVLLDKPKEWRFLNESKIINGYLCYKATREKEIRKRARVEVIAWYCPEITFNNGPKEFGGLPGLILEIQDGRFTFLVSKIDLSQKQEINIQKIEGKIINEDAFDKICEEIKEKMFNNMQKN
jgi:GLPGLI family protein